MDFVQLVVGNLPTSFKLWNWKLFIYLLHLSFYVIIKNISREFSYRWESFYL